MGQAAAVAGGCADIGLHQEWNSAKADAQGQTNVCCNHRYAGGASCRSCQDGARAVGTYSLRVVDDWMADVSDRVDVVDLTQPVHPRRRNLAEPPLPSALRSVYKQPPITQPATQFEPGPNVSADVTGFAYEADGASDGSADFDLPGSAWRGRTTSALKHIQHGGQESARQHHVSTPSAVHAAGATNTVHMAETEDRGSAVPGQRSGTWLQDVSSCMRSAGFDARSEGTAPPLSARSFVSEFSIVSEVPLMDGHPVRSLMSLGPFSPDDAGLVDVASHGGVVTGHLVALEQACVSQERGDCVATRRCLRRRRSIPSPISPLSLPSPLVPGSPTQGTLPSSYARSEGGGFWATQEDFECETADVHPHAGRSTVRFADDPAERGGGGGRLGPESESPGMVQAPPVVRLRHPW